MSVQSAVPAVPRARRGSRTAVRWIVGCLALLLLSLLCLCCLLTAALGAWLWQQYTAVPADPQALTALVQQQVSELRGLEFLEPVALQTMTTEELRERVQEDFFEDWSPEDARDYTLTLAAFDLLDAETDLYQTYLDLYSEGIAGFYDPETKELYVISDAGPLGVLDRVTLAHELTHALQDQHYDLLALGYSDEAQEEHDSEYLGGLQGLVEGDASLLEMQYLGTLSPLDWARLLWEYTQLDLSVYDTLPDVIMAGFTFPYEQGQAFVSGLHGSGGWAAVDAAFANPPQSTEQLMHPERYRTGDAPQVVSLPPLTDTLGSGWHLADEDVMGEFYTRMHLSRRLKPYAATRVAQGWGGDRYAVYYNDTYRPDSVALVLAWRSTWDDQAEADEFVAGYRRYLSDKAGHAAAVDDEDLACWHLADGYRCLGWNGATATVVRGPDVATVERVLEALAEP